MQYLKQFTRIAAVCLLAELLHALLPLPIPASIYGLVLMLVFLLTGLVNTQVVRTAEMMDMHCIVFVRSKQPTPEIIELAEESGIVLLASPKRMYEACGILYSNGLVGNKVKE